MQKYLLPLRYSLNNVVRDHVRQCLSLISAAKSTQCNIMGIPCRAWQGVSQMLYPDQPSMCLVSNGAELVVLSKRLFLERANDACMRHIRQTVRSLVKLVYRQIVSEEVLGIEIPEGERREILYTYRYTVIIRMTPVLRWAAI